jgi:hypothetical protein
MGKKLITTLLLISLGQFAWAQSLVPATSDDLSDFDQQLSKIESKKSDSSAAASTKKPKNSNFGATVSQKAKDLKKEDLEQKKKMGQWVRDQRSQDDEKTPANSQGKGQGAANSNSSNKDARTSSPANNDRGNSNNSPGHSGNH